ncbi:hypothetical protein D3C77_658860 [compost metagenome]
MLQPGLKRIDQLPLSARGRNQLHLQAALAARQEHIALERLRRCRDTALHQHGRQCGRAALVVFLGKEGDILQLNLRRQVRSLRHQQRRPRTRAQQENQQ